MEATEPWDVYQTAYANNEAELQERIQEEKHRTHGRKRLYVTSYTPTEYEELIFIDGRDFKSIFNETDANRSRSKSAVVKITNPQNGKSIYRLFRTCGDIQNMGGHYAGMTYTAIRLLTTNDEEIKSLTTVQLSEGDKCHFYWNHPVAATRLSVRYGVWGIICSIVCAIVSCIVSLILC